MNTRLAAGGGGGATTLTVIVSDPLMFSVAPPGSVAVAVAVMAALTGLVEGVPAVIMPPFGFDWSGATVKTVVSAEVNARFESVAWEAAPVAVTGDTVKLTVCPEFSVIGILNFPSMSTSKDSTTLSHQ